MTANRLEVARLRDAISNTSAPTAADAKDYKIAISLGSSYLARGQSGAPTLLIPLDEVPTAVGRRGGGFLLIPMGLIAFEYQNRTWQQPAATLECTEPRITDAFLVLVADIARRIESLPGQVTWRIVLGWVEEWQTLFSQRRILSYEQQLGLWGETWLISISKDADLLAASWRGPESDAVDFFCNGRGLEVKVSRQHHVHHASLSQVDQPVGEHDTYFLSIWVGIDPANGVSLGELIDKTLASLTDPAAFLRQLIQVGYSPLDRDEYSTRFALLELPRWFRSEDVPKIRAMDAGITQVRYVVTLDSELAIPEAISRDLWTHFCGETPSLKGNR
jgi:hypothetical protein